MPDKIVITRPRADAIKLAARFKAKGIECMIEPMLDIEYLDDPDFAAADAQAIVLTSANGARAVGRTNAPRDLPVLAVGEKTAEAARAEGFRHVEAASGDVQALSALAAERLDPAKGPVIHVSGSDIAGDLGGALEARAFTYRRHVLYKAHAATRLSEALIEALQAGAVAGIVFYSARTAATFVMLAKQAGLAASFGQVTAYCLSEAVADAARAVDWADIRVSVRPEEEAR